MFFDLCAADGVADGECGAEPSDICEDLCDCEIREMVEGGRKEYREAWFSYIRDFD